MQRFGSDLPAAGFSLYVERVHLAQMEEERLARGSGEGARDGGRPHHARAAPLKLAVPRGALLRGDARRPRAHRL